MTNARNAWVLAVFAAAVVIVATMDTGRAAPIYSTYSIHGTYRIAFTGVSLSTGRLESGVGIMVAYGTGGITGVESFNNGGQLCTNVAVKGTYTVEPNGLGTLSATFTSPVPGCSGDFNLGLLVLNGGNLVKAFAAGSGFVTLSEDWFRE